MGREANRVSGVEYTSTTGHRTLVLACSAVETARVLLNNRTKEFPNGLANSSPQLAGRDHTDDAGTGYYHSLLTGINWDKPNPNYEGTYQVQCGGGMGPQRLTYKNEKGFGSALVTST